MKFLIFSFIFSTLFCFSITIEHFLSGCGNDITYNTCCIQTAHILALTSASALACADAIAAVHACASVSTAAGIAASVVASSTAEVSVSQSISVTVNTGKCCEIANSVSAQAQSSANSAAFAAAEAEARAEAAAEASASAISAAQSAAFLFAEAQASINSSCCNYTFQFTSALQIIGEFSSYASAAADITVGLSSQIKLVARVASFAAANATSSAKALASNSIDNCCVNTKLRSRANVTASASAIACQQVKKAISLIQSAFTSIKMVSNDAQSILNFGTLSDQICANDCANVTFTCCQNQNDTNCSAAAPLSVCDVGTQITTKAFISAASKARAAVVATVYVETGAYVLANAITQATAAADAAIYVTSAVSVEVFACCSIRVNINSAASARACAISAAFAQAKAAALVYANATASSAALANSTASALAISQASYKLLYDANNCRTNCCLSSSYPSNRTCCEVSSAFERSFSPAYASDIAGAVGKAYFYVREGVKTAVALNTTSIADVLRETSTKRIFFLNCCCCAKTTTAGTSTKVMYMSTATGVFSDI